MNKWNRVAFTAALLASAAPAIAGDQPLYAPAPEWVTLAKLPDAAQMGTGGPVLYDLQERIDGASVWNYADTAIKLSTPELLAQNSNLTVAWNPGHGDLIIHQLSIIRGDEVIDALAGGQKFTVLRREQQLEQSQLTGILSATLPVEGLRVGDILRLRMSITMEDKALGGRAQTAQMLLADPVKVAAANYSLSWRTAEPVKWKLYAEKVDAKPARNGAFSSINIAMPVPKQSEIPNDAPGRFQRPALIEVSNFADWAQVSRTMAPLYQTKDSIAADSGLAAEVAAIRTATDDPLRRTAMALQLTQDKIRYLAVSLNNGNYIPQSPAKTWELRYGDCKAKTLMLLAILHALDIEAEPVMVHSQNGDIVADRLPSAQAFDHIIVRAKIGGESLWLDGTGLGSRLEDIRDTPSFGHVLPVRDSGGALEKIALRPPARPTIDLTINADESTSYDLPSVIDVNMAIRGQLASLLTLSAANLPEKEKEDVTKQFLMAFLGEGQFDKVETILDPEGGSATIKARGIVTAGWRREDGRSERPLGRATYMLQFSPDRARPAWATIPVQTPSPDYQKYRLRLRLPDGGQGYKLEGGGPLETSIGGYAITRTVDLTDGVVTVDEAMTTSGREIPADQVAAERERASLFSAQAPHVIAPENALRRWDVSGAKYTSQRDAIGAVYTLNMTKADEEDTSALTSAASFFYGTGNFKAAEDARTRELALLPSVDGYLSRARARQQLGNIAGALADAEEARKLDPSDAAAVSAVAALTAEKGDVAKAAGLLDERIALGGKTRDAYRVQKAVLVGEYGDAAAAIADLDKLIEEKPGVPNLLNARCWVKASRNVQVDTALKDCTSALELSDNTAAILDSRAFVWFRLGREEDALRDLDAALKQAPGMANSHYLRGLIAKRQGKAEQSATDLATARRIEPALDREFARYGLKP